MVRDTPRDPDARQAALDAAHPTFATSIDVQRESATRPADALPDLVGRAPGASVRSLGGLGQFSAVSLRGASPQQTQVLLDGVPLAGSMAGLVDLSDLPADALSRVEVYRGFVPIAFGGSSLGGAVQLVTAPGRTASAGVDTGMGSIGARQARLHVVTPLPRRVVLTTRLGYGGATGNFPARDIGTPLDPDDDRDVRRVNNDYERLLGQVRVDGRAGRTRWDVQELIASRRQGIPGPAGTQWDGTTLQSIAARTVARIQRDELGGPGGRLQWITALTAGGRRFSDPRDVVGVGADDEVTRTVDGYASPRLRLPLWRGGYLGVVGDARGEWIAVDERLAPPPAGDGRRQRAGFGAGVELEQFLFADRLLLAPAWRSDAVVSRFAVTPGAGTVGDDGQDRTDLGHSPRLAARLRMIDGLGVRASVGRYFRTPTLVELFGDRGFAVGNPGLRPERGTSADGGLLFDRSIGAHALRAEAVGFWAQARDLVQWVSTGSVARASNVDRATMAGFESSLALRLWSDLVELRGSYTFLHTANGSSDPTRRGAPLPGRPRHDFNGRLAVGREHDARGTALGWRVGWDTEIVDKTYLDPSARLELPLRIFHGLSAELGVARRVFVGFSVRNLFDRRTTTWQPPVANVDRPITVPVVDFLGYPLPGRSLWASIRVDLGGLGQRAKGDA